MTDVLRCRWAFTSARVCVVHGTHAMTALVYMTWFNRRVVVLKHRAFALYY